MKGANARGDTRKGRSVQAITDGDRAVIAMTYGDLIPLFSGNLASGSDSDSRGHAQVSAQVRIGDRIQISDRMIVDVPCSLVNRMRKHERTGGGQQIMQMESLEAGVLLHQAGPFPFRILVT